MTKRRWQKDQPDDGDDFGFGPVETAARAELESIGWVPGSVSAMATLAEQACSLAETMDRTQNSATLPRLNGELRDTMADARKVAETKSAGVQVREVTTDELAAQRANRRPGPPPVGEGTAH